MKAAILFIINRSDCEAFRPCHEACMMFSQMLLKAHNTGVLLIAKEIIWSGGKAYSGRNLPINFDSSINATIDENHLERILKFNENGSGKTPSPSKKKLKEREEAKLLEIENENKDVKIVNIKESKKIVLKGPESSIDEGNAETKDMIKKKKVINKEKIVKKSDNIVVIEAADDLVNMVPELEGVIENKKKVSKTKANKAVKDKVIENVIIENIDIKTEKLEGPIVEMKENKKKVQKIKAIKAVKDNFIENENIDIKKEKLEGPIIEMKENKKKVGKRKADSLSNNDIIVNDKGVNCDVKIEDSVIDLKKSKKKIEKKNDEEKDNIPVVRKSTRKRSGDGDIKLN